MMGKRMAVAESDRGKEQETKITFIVFLSLLSGLSPFAMSIVVPSIPGLARAFQLDYDSLQYVVSAYLLGIGLSQPIHGFLCDRYGRRPVLLISLLLFTMATFICMFVENWHLLITMRFIQAVGVSVGTVTSRAIVTDIWARQKAAQVLSYVAMAMGLGPIVAPVLGGYLDVTFGWQSSFLASGLLGMLVLLFAWFRLLETRPQEVMAASGSFGDALRRYLILLKSRNFIGYTLIFGFCQGTFFAFLPVAPQIFESRYQVGAEAFGLYWGLLSLSYMAGAFSSGKLVRIFDLDKTLAFGCIGIFTTIMFLLGVSLAAPLQFPVLVCSVTVAMFFSGIACPLALTGSVSDNPSMTGAASGLSSSLGMGVGALFSLLTGYVYDGTSQPMILLMSLTVTGCLLSLFLSRSKGGEAAEI